MSKPNSILDDHFKEKIESRSLTSTAVDNTMSPRESIASEKLSIATTATNDRYDPEIGGLELVEAIETSKC